MQNISTSPAPSLGGDRIQALDALRGMAVLGILIMNIQSFCMPDAAYLNPDAYGDLTGANAWVWIVSHLFADQKFMSIFSMLFGAGIILITRKTAASGKSGLGLHYSRTAWLLVLGLAHAYLLWHGDILVNYAVCALFIVFFRNRKPLTLMIVGFLFVLVPGLLYYYFAWSQPYWPEEMTQQMSSMWAPSAEQIRQELDLFRSGWVEQLPRRFGTSLMMQTMVYCIWMGWRACGMMLMGMALFKWGVLSASKSKRFYMIQFLGGMAVGVPLVIYGIFRNFTEGWSFEYSMYHGWQFNYWGSLFMALGYVGLAMLIVKTFRQGVFVGLMKNVGRMAFTNYLLQTVVCTLLCYGHGFGLYGRLERYEQALVVLGVWVVLVVLSKVWLRRFYFGPAEWLWRSLTYFKMQSFKRIDR